MPRLSLFSPRTALPVTIGTGIDEHRGAGCSRFGQTTLGRNISAAQPATESGRCSCGTTPLAVRMRMRSGQRPCFEGSWRCGRPCLTQAIKTAVRREFRNGLTSESRIRHRIPLGLILQTRGLITAEQLRFALQEQAETGGRLGDVLQRSFAVDEREIAGALAAQWNAPLWHLPTVPPADLLQVAPLPLFRLSNTFPIRLIGTRLSLASADGIDPPIALALERMHGVTVESGIAVSSSLTAAWQTLSAASTRPVEEVPCDDADEISRRMVRTVESTQPIDARAVRLGRRMWLRLWLEPAAVIGGPCHSTDILDYLFTLPSR